MADRLTDGQQHHQHHQHQGREGRERAVRREHDGFLGEDAVQLAGRHQGAGERQGANAQRQAGGGQLKLA